MRRQFLTILCTISIVACYSQHLTYSTFMKVANMEKFSDVSKTLRGYGYIFQGSNKDYSENDSTNVSTAAWSKNCSFDINTGQYRFNIGENFSIYKCFSYELFPWQIYCEYTISSESDYNLFIKTAQQNGFKYEKEAVTDADFCVTSSVPFAYVIS